jgi:hypothetical protein
MATKWMNYNMITNYEIIDIVIFSDFLIRDFSNDIFEMFFFFFLFFFLRK